MNVRLDFVKYDDDEDAYEEEKKEENVNLTKESYKDHFPTLSQTNKNQP